MSTQTRPYRAIPSYSELFRVQKRGEARSSLFRATHHHARAPQAPIRDLLGAARTKTECTQPLPPKSLKTRASHSGLANSVPLLGTDSTFFQVNPSKSKLKSRLTVQPCDARFGWHHAPRITHHAPPPLHYSGTPFDFPRSLTIE